MVCGPLSGLNYDVHLSRHAHEPENARATFVYNLVKLKFGDAANCHLF